MRFWLHALSLPALLLACDGPLRLEVVESRQEGGTEQGGKAPIAGTDSESGVNAGGRSGDGMGGSVAEGGTVTDGGRAGAGGTSDGGGDMSMAGMPPVDPWDGPALFTASFSSHAFPEQYMQHVEDQGFINLIDMGSVTEKQAASFDMIPGLDRSICGKQDCVSFRAVDVKGNFFRHAGSRIYLHPAQDMPLFLSDATFCMEPGLADPEGVTFRSTNYAQRVIHLRNGNELWIDNVIADDATFASEATFYRETPLMDRE
jgi:hypothetical protein